jgi:hypothetical protein
MERTYTETTAENFLFPFFGKINTRLFFILIFILQVLLIFQGFDLSDEGFLSTFYSRIFSNPNSVSYNFMFWLTGVIGGAWSKISSPLGLLGLRLGGAIVNTLTVILTYYLLKKYLKPEYLKLGLLLVVLSLNNDIKILNYNTLSSFFYVTVIIFLFTGLQKNQFLNILVGGFIAGLNIFIRTPNILELGLVLGILYNNYLSGQSSTIAIRQISGFLTGFIAAIVVVVFAMYLSGHLPIYLGSLKLLYAMGKGQVQTTEIQGGYGLSRLLYLFRSNNVVSIKYALIVVAGISGLVYLNNKFKNNSKPEKIFTQAVVYFAITVTLFLIIIRRIDHFTILFTITGLILLTAVSMAFTHIEKERKLLFFFGCFFLLSFPLGSSDGIYTAGRYCLWIALPITMDYLLKIRSFNFNLSVLRDKQEFSGKVWVGENHLGNVKKWLVFIFVFAGFYFVYFYPFFDRRNRIQMHYALQSDKLKGIYTTKGRAEVFNELLRESAKYIKEDDYVIAYDDMAIFYYATNTIPQLSNPLPAVYNTYQFQSDLNSIFEKSRNLPPVIRQKIATIGDASKWPEEILPVNYFTMERNLDKNNILDSFLKKNNYQEVWANKVFMILIPDSTNSQSKFKAPYANRNF